MKFLLVMTFLVCIAGSANAKCFNDVGDAIKPIAITDDRGEVDLLTPSGTPIHVRGLPANTEVCRNLLFKMSAWSKWGGRGYYDAPRPAKDCHGLRAGHTCVHIRGG
jgi:hypothetical protein